jgi:hypothetical protein
MTHVLGVLLGWLIAGVGLAITTLGMGHMLGLFVAYDYDVRAEFLIVRGHVGPVVFWYRKIDVDVIAEFRPFSVRKDMLHLGWMWGVLPRQWWTIRLKRRVDGMSWIYISLRDEVEGQRLSDAIELRRSS